MTNKAPKASSNQLLKTIKTQKYYAKRYQENKETYKNYNKNYYNKNKLKIKQNKEEAKATK